jgi:hypothetical protein
MNKNNNVYKFNEKEIMMYFHTSLRNIGLFTSVSLAMLGYSRFYRGKNIIYNVTFILISLAFLAMTMYKTMILERSLNKMTSHLNDPDIYEIRSLIKIPRYTFYLNIIVFSFGVFTLGREFTK